MLQWAACLPTFAMRVASAVTLIWLALLHKVELATVEENPTWGATMPTCCAPCGANLAIRHQGGCLGTGTNWSKVPIGTHLMGAVPLPLVACARCIVAGF